MATRLYIHNGRVDSDLAVNPAFGSWTVTSGASRQSLRPFRQGVGNSNTTLTSSLHTPAAAENYALGQAISWPLLYPITISGTVKGVFYSQESVATADSMPQALIRVVSNDGSTVRGTLYDFDNSALSNELSSTGQVSAFFPRNWTGSGAALTSVDAQAGDRIVVELGTRNTGLVSMSSSIRIGLTNETTDAPENETDTSAASKNGWIEFSSDLIFAPTPRSSASSLSALCGDTQSKATGTTLAVAVATAQPQVGDLCLVSFSADPAAGTYSCADDAGNSYALVDQQTNGSGTSGVTTCLFASLITTALTAAQNVTVTHPSLAARAMVVSAWAFVNSATPDTFSGGNTSASPASAGNITPANNLELVWGVCGIQNPSATFSGTPTNYQRTRIQGTSGGGAASNIGIAANYWLQTTATTTDHPQAQSSSVLTADIAAAFVGLPAPPTGPPYDRQPLWNPIFAQ